MYHKASISPLSSTQLSKILNGHSVRVSAGNEHDVELSKEQFKKFRDAVLNDHKLIKKFRHATNN